MPPTRPEWRRPTSPPQGDGAAQRPGRLRDHRRDGLDQYPTPKGTFYVTDLIDLRWGPGTGYGAYALGLSGHSDVLNEFSGVATTDRAHGTDNPGDVGQAISHGCVRFQNDDIIRLSTLPLGTPVFIT